MRKRNKGINIRVTEREKKKIEFRADICNLSTSEYLRKLALGFEPRELPKDGIYDALLKLEKQIEDLKSFLNADQDPEKLLSFTEATRKIRNTMKTIWKLLMSNYDTDLKGSDIHGDN